MLFTKNDVSRGRVIVALAILAIGVNSAQAYNTPQATVDPQYQNFNSIDLQHIPLPTINPNSLPTSLPSSFSLSDFFHIDLTSLTQGSSTGLLGGIVGLVLNIFVALVSVVIQIIKVVLSYIPR